MMRALPFIAFFASGASSLIFQGIWTRMLHHVFGATSVAMSSVLSAFMAGLGLGAFWLGRRAHLFKNPLRLYALCELGVGGCALLIPWLVRVDGPLADINAALRQSLGADSAGFMFARFLCVFPWLLVPTTLMGGTLPLLAQHFVGSRPSSADSARIGALYAINTLGAVLGTLLGNFVLMPWVGVSATNLVAVAINVTLALSIFVMPRLSRNQSAEPTVEAEEAPRSPSEVHSQRVQLLSLIAFGLSGACALTYEVVWSRALSMAIGSSMQSFALILITFLLGIAGGSAVLSADLTPDEDREVPSSLSVRCAASSLLSLIALAPTLVLTSVTNALVAFSVACGIIAAVFFAARAKARAERALGASALEVFDRASLTVLSVPCGISAVEVVRFATRRIDIAAVSDHGFLPYISASVVAAIAAFLALEILCRGRVLYLAGLMQLLIAVSTFISYLFQDEIPYAFARMVSSLEDLPSHVGTVRFFMFLCAGLCTLPATLGMGAMFPITLRLWGEGARAGENVAAVYASNTVGSICGAWLPGFLLMPWLGMEKTLQYAMLLNAGLALAMLMSGSARMLSAACAGLIAAFCLTVLPPGSSVGWNLSHMTLGAFRVSLARSVLDTTTWGEPDLLYYQDGLSTTVSVERWGSHLSLKNNGKVDASNGDDMPTQIMVAAYPILLHPSGGRDADVAIVGFGSGVTVGAALQFPVKHVDAMELERNVVHAAVEFFSDVNHLPASQPDFPYLKVPRLSLTSDDGRNFLASTRAKYDIIISEPSNPWITGVSDLFTVEHFQISKQRLKPGGVYCQWVQLYEMSPENIKTIYRTFASQFRYVVAFAAEELSSDTILVGSDAPIVLDLGHLTQTMQNPVVQRELDRAFVHTPYHVLSRLLFASKAEIMDFAGAPPKAVLNTDDNMWIELRAPEDLIGFSRYQGYLSTFYGPKWPYGHLEGHITGLDTDLERSSLALTLLGHGRRTRAKAWIERVRDRQDAEVQRMRRAVLAMLDGEPEPKPQFEPAEPGPQLDPPLRSRLLSAEREAMTLVGEGKYTEARDVLESLPAPLLAQCGPGLRFLDAYVTYKSAGESRGQLHAAGEKLEALIRSDEAYADRHPELLYFTARAFDGASSFDRAVRSMRGYVARTESPATP